MAMIVEVPVTYEALVVPPRSQNERRALLVTTLALRIPDAEPSLAVAARLQVREGLGRWEPTARDGSVEYFTEGDGSRGLLERMPAVLMNDEGSYGHLRPVEADLPLGEAIQHMVGGSRGGLKAIGNGQFWNPFGLVGSTSHGGYGVLAHESADFRSVRASPSGPSREAAIEAAHAAAAGMRALPDGRVLVPSVGPVWKVGHADEARRSGHATSGTLQAQRLTASTKHGAADSGFPVDWRWHVRGDRFEDAAGMARAFGGQPEAERAASMEILRPEAFLVDDRSLAWAATAEEFLTRAPGTFRIEDIWGGRPQFVGGQDLGPYRAAWSMDVVIAALQTRDAVLRDDPAEAAACASRVLDAVPELRGRGGFDLVEAQGRRLLGGYDRNPEAAPGNSPR